MDIKPVFNNPKRPIIIAGPCSAETEAQVLQTAYDLLPIKPDLFRAGIWKPRTRPNSFEGVGKQGLAWLRRVKEETGIPVCTEVAKARHITEALSHGIDVLWLGARTTVNPFSVQELANELQGVEVPVLVKNPVNPDLQLWIGAIERLYQAGITRIAAVHRGFSYYGQSPYRNVPRWQLPIELKRHFPDLQIICDNSHICGRRDTLLEVAQRAMDLNFHGLMTEVHPNPDEAWSDAAQQITAKQFQELLEKLVLRSSMTDDLLFQRQVESFRKQINEIDEEMLALLGARMQLAEQIGLIKREGQVVILQEERWSEVLENALARGSALGLSRDFVYRILKAVHQESINHQAFVMNNGQILKK